MRENRPSGLMRGGKQTVIGLRASQSVVSRLLYSAAKDLTPHQPATCRQLPFSKLTASHDALSVPSSRELNQTSDSHRLPAAPALAPADETLHKLPMNLPKRAGLRDRESGQHTRPRVLASAPSPTRTSPPLEPRISQIFTDKTVSEDAFGEGAKDRTRGRVRSPEAGRDGAFPGRQNRGCRKSIRALLVTFFLACFLAPALSCFADGAQSSGTFGDLNITGDVQITGSTFAFGTALLSGSNTSSGVALTYTDFQPDTQTNAALTWTAFQQNQEWIWESLVAGNPASPIMKIDAGNALNLYPVNSDTNTFPSIVLDPSLSGTSSIAGSISVTGSVNQMPNQTLTGGSSSILTLGLADQRYLQGIIDPLSSALTLGSGATISGSGDNTGAIAIGSGASASGNSALSLGSAAVASTDYSVALGYGAQSYGHYSMAVGQSTAEGVGAMVFGIGSDASGYLSLALGFSCNARGDNSIAAGSYATTGDDFTTGIGMSSVACKACSSAFGYDCLAQGAMSLAVGYNAQAYGPSSASLGYCTTSLGEQSQALGYSTTAETFRETVVGAFNVLYDQAHDTGSRHAWYPDDALFTIGNGASQGSPSDALVVKKSGDTTIYGRLTVSGTANGGIVVTGTSVQVTLSSGTTAAKIVASGTNALMLIPEQGDLSMGDFINGPQPQPATAGLSDPSHPQQ